MGSQNGKVGKMTRQLSAKQEAFCREYVIDLNATQASIRAGYSEKTAANIGNENLRKPQIQERLAKLINSRSERLEISADWVLSELKKIHELDILDIMNDELTAFKKLSEWPKIWRTSISGMDVMTITGESDMEQVVNKIKWPDKTKNLDMIGRHVNVKAWEKEKQVTNVSNNIMPVPTADSIDSWEAAAQQQQDAILSNDE